MARVQLRTLFAVYLLVAFNVHPALAQDIKQCEGVLIPAIESIKKDYRLLQAFAKINSDELYDEIAKSEGKSAGGGGSYAGFGADYRESKTKQEFNQRTEKRLTDEKYSLSEQDSRAYYRVGITPKQIEGWSNCVAQVSGATSVLLSASSPDAGSFTLKASWLPGVGVGSASLNLSVTGGAFADGSATLTETFTGKTSKGYVVSRAPNQQTVRVIANIAGATDSLLMMMPRSLPVQLVKKSKECLEIERCPEGRVVACFPAPALRTEVPEDSIWMEGPASSEYATAKLKTTDIEFGSWTNPQCSRATGREIGGNGWHARIGSCGQGGGEGWQRCVKVRVEYEAF